MQPSDLVRVSNALPFDRGLSARAAADALAIYGKNVIAPPRQVPALLAWIVRIATDPMALLLGVAAATYFAVGDRVDALVSVAALLPIVAVGVVLEGRSDAALASLRELTAPRARVRRDGVDIEIGAEDVVPQDLLIIAEGDVVAADGELIDGRVAIDESALTGESVPVQHAPDHDPAVAAGTTVIGGRGVARVTATGNTTRYGRIGALLGTLKTPRTPIEAAIRSLVGRLGAVVILVCIVVVLVERAHGSALSVALIAGVSLAMAVIPEELPMVYTLYLALGAWRLARDSALVRRLGSVETLGSVSTMCMDKTGTLTSGRVELAEIVPFDDSSSANVLMYGLLACDVRGADPLDAAFTRAVVEDPRSRAQLVGNEPYDASRGYAAKRWRLDGDDYHALKGALEALLPLIEKDNALSARAQETNDALGARGMRVLAVAGSRNGAPLRLLGLVAFRDPIRADARESVAAFRAASVRVVMVTGDHPVTASAVAREVGFGDDAARVVTGDALAGASDEELTPLVNGARVFARIKPEQKLAIVRALRRAGQVVAMTGDGTNDALALREADIGIAMGERGTEVAREAAGLVLLDDDSSTIVRAIRDGRRIFENLRHAFCYLVGFHIPLLVATIALPILGMPLLLQPIHLVWLELIVHPTSSLVFEADSAAPDIMRRPPRLRGEGLLRLDDWLKPVLLGLALAVTVVAIYAAALTHGIDVEASRATAIIAMLVGQTVLVFVQRSPRRPVWRGPAPTRTAWWLVAITLASVVLAITWPPLGLLLHLEEPAPAVAFGAAAAGALATLWLEPFKR